MNQQLAQHYWPNQDPIGKRFRLDDEDKAWVQIVGLAKTSKYIFIAEPPTDFVYLPYRQQKPQRMIMVAQSAGDPATLAGPLREVVARPRRQSADFQRADDGRALPDAGGQHLQRADHDDRRHGTDGTRPRDRRPLRPGRVCGEPDARERSASGWRSARTARPCCGWCCDRASCSRSWDWRVGLVASVGAGELLQAAFPSGDDQSDFVALLLVIPIVLAVTFLAAYVPARQASRVDPILALRHE